MSLRLIYGKTGSGKTSFCIKEALESGKKVYYVTPEQFTFTAEKRICKLVNVHGLGGVEVLSFKKLALRILAEEEGAALPRLDSRVKAILIQKILVDAESKLSVMRGLVHQPGTAGMLGKLFSEMRRYMITADAVRSVAASVPALEKKLTDIALLYEAYLSNVNARFSDGDDDLHRLASVLIKKNVLEDVEVYLDRFDGFDASEYAAIRAMLSIGVPLTVTIGFSSGDEVLPPFVLQKKMESRLRAIAVETGATLLSSVTMERERNVSKPLRFLKEAYFVYPTRQYPKQPEGLELVAAGNPLGEIHHVARRILWLCREKGYLYRDIAVTARNIAGYERYIEAVLPMYGIPFFMDRTIHISEHPLVVFLLSALELITKGYTYESVFRYVKAGFLRIPSEAVDTLENFVLATGIRGNIWKSEEKWNMRAAAYADRETDEDAEMQKVAEDTRRRIVAPLLRLEENLKKGKSAAEKCRAIYDFMQEMKISRRILAVSRLFEKKGDFASAAEYRGVYNDFVEALDGVCDAFGNEEISTVRLYTVLKTALSEVETGIIPSAQDGVSVGSIDRIVGYDVKAVFAIGVQDGVFPAQLERGGVLSNAERSMLIEKGLEISGGETRALYEEEYYILKCLSLPSSYLELSYPSANMDGSTQRPSRVYQRIKEMFPQVRERNLLLDMEEADKISVPEMTLQYLLQEMRAGNVSEEMRAAYGWLMEKMPECTKEAVSSLNYTNRADRLSQDTIRAIMGDTLHGSVSRLEKLAACPFSYYATYILGAKERKIMQPGAADAGRFLHDFLELFSRRLWENGKRWHEVDDTYIKQEFDEIVPVLDRRLSAYMLENSPRYAQLFVRLEKAVKEAVSMLVLHMKQCNFQPLGYELSFSDGGDLKPLTFTLPGGGKVKLSGRIDRADALQLPENQGTLVRIIDYKSGSKDFELDDVYFGLNLQLAVYISALCAPENSFITGEDAKPAGMLYFRLVDPVVDASPMEEADKIEKMRRNAFKLKGIVLSDEKILRHMDTGMESGSEIIPAKIGKTGVTGSVASAKQFDVLSRYVKKTVSQLLLKLEEGCVDIAPYRKNDISACTYCKFSSFCAHGGREFRDLEKRKAEEIWKEMEGEV